MAAHAVSLECLGYPEPCRHLGFQPSIALIVRIIIEIAQRL
jgi:hypothetical protein